MRGGIDFRDIVKAEGVPYVFKEYQCGVCGFKGKYRETLNGGLLGGCAMCGWDPRRDPHYDGYWAWVEERNASTTQKKMPRGEDGVLLRPVDDSELDINPIYCMTRVRVKHIRKRGGRRSTGLMS